jgi:transposase-like protein
MIAEPTGTDGHRIPAEERVNALRRVHEQHESLRHVAAHYGVSHETIRRLLLTSDTQSAG